MPPRVRWFAVCLVLSLASTVTIASAVFPRFMRTHVDALFWGLVGSALLLLATFIAGLGVAMNREGSMPTGVKVVLALVLIFGVGWAYLSIAIMGL